MADSGADLLLGDDGRSPDQQRALVATLFKQPRSMAVNAAGSLVVACVCWRHTGQPGYLWWGVACLAVTALRLGIATAFNRGPDRLPPDMWARLFLAGAVATAAVMGAGVSATVLSGDDPMAQLFMACNAISFAGAAAVRNGASPLAARSQTAVALGLPGLACLASGKPYLEVFSLLVLLHLAAQFEIIRALGNQTRWLMSAERNQALANARLSQACAELEAANSRLLELSSTDGLTGLSNRRAFDTALGSRWMQACRDAFPLALMMIDADCFKRFNDRHGHVAGDSALRSAAAAISAALRRPGDCGARFGGEEFAVLLPGTDLQGALSLAEEIRRSVPATAIDGLPGVALTVSIGVASLMPRPGQDSRELLMLADEALYRAKENGRDRVEGARRSFVFPGRSRAGDDAGPPPVRTQPSASTPPLVEGAV